MCEAKTKPRLAAKGIFFKQSINIILVISLAHVAWGGSLSPAPKDSSYYSAGIDRLVKENYETHGITPNPRIDDQTFMRRIYLDIIGRIPTYQEAARFLTSEEPNKRSVLIDELLDSEGYVSHQFNYWADLLRVVSKSKIRGGGQAYAEWLKHNIRQNTPYDKLVTALLTSEGYPWENPAVEYYMRDSGMPLDNASNTAQVFLGTRMQCAQCHDHPFDKWTQNQFFQMAAYTYGVNTRTNLRKIDVFAELQKRIRQSSLEEKEKKTVSRSAQKLFRPFRFTVTETNRTLKLPEDYQYDDAKPKSKVSPHPPFGEIQPPKKAVDRTEAYAAWMTSLSNERFTKVITNRIWKKVMGYGLFEPVDNLTDETTASNPKLLDALEKTMQIIRFDLKEFQRILFNTEVYQREAYGQDILAGSDYHFPGPLLRRMTAEQVWDSLLTLSVPNIDQQKGNTNYKKNFANFQKLLNTDAYHLAHMSREVVQIEEEINSELRKLRPLIEEARSSGNTKKFNELNKKRRKLNNQRNQALNTVTAKYTSNNNEMMGGSNMVMQSEMTMMEGASNSNDKKNQKKKNNKRNKDMVRASELSSPAYASHMLREFGQSDRQTIGAATQEATIPQVLSLLNSSVHYRIFKKNTVLNKEIWKAKSAAGKIDVLFLSILGRSATEQEIELLSPQIEKEKQKAIHRIAWSLLNTRQFIFIQ